MKKYFTMSIRTFLKILLAIVFAAHIIGCVSDKVADQGVISAYHAAVVEKGPQQRMDASGLGSLIPERKPGLLIIPDKTGRRTIRLSLEDVVARVLSQSPEITIVSFDPSIAREDVTKAVSEFDVTLFERFSSEQEDNPTDNIFKGGESDSRLLEMGIRQKGTTGAEWSLAYALARNWDDSITRTIATRYEPMLTFQLKQPLLRDAWQGVNRAETRIAKLNYRSALTAFRKKTEEVAADVIAIYWTLLQAREDVKIQQELLDKTDDTLEKVEKRKDIDATRGDINQAEASVKSRQAQLIQAEKRLVDVQDALVRLLSDSMIHLLGDYEIVPVTPPTLTIREYDQSKIIEQALENNPDMQQARMEIDVADINIEFSKKQRMPRLDLVASGRLQGLSDEQDEARKMLHDANFKSYTLGIVFEYPLGNRQAEAEFRRRKLEKSKALSKLQNISDQIAAQVKERLRLVDSAIRELDAQRDAVKAAKIHLQSIEDAEKIKRLSPEFLLTKLQAQESLAIAQRAEIKAVVDYNIAMIRLAQTAGTVLDMRYVKPALSAVADREKPGLIVTDGPDGGE
jgi:outer membrane protein TolC